MQTISTTAGWTAAARELETARADRFLEDPVTLCTEVERRQWHDVVVSVLGYSPPVVPVRARLGDEVVRAAAEDGIRQVVSLAAGLESRVLRLDLPEDLLYVEVDLPALLEARSLRLAEAGPAARPACRRVEVAADLSGDWHRSLEDAGFDPRARTLWVVEGLLPYLDADSCHTLLRTVRSLSAPGSRLWCDHVHPDVFAAAHYAPVLKSLEALGVLWASGWTDPVAQLAADGWRARAWTVKGLAHPEPDNPPVAWMPPVPARTDTSDSGYHWLIWAHTD
ncbi:SAM-dependent methyltransferase [Streptomyces sp. UNOC14_S4]|uniref:class I SAM-dependent methyltransferase n=1 Tax=Streptomyces sp. UNOC14_S4 TaxID=2872340 RepID=UPI001E5172AA|nr:SAM-dependent methyltransferase [Streptomyces sp. UNOC14_S4]MCC3769855.1 SAM-dependent methyltransferase [Streptomyces sp. UNOC14_S4]